MMKIIIIGLEPIPSACRRYAIIHSTYNNNPNLMLPIISLLYDKI